MFISAKVFNRILFPAVVAALFSAQGFADEVMIYKMKGSSDGRHEYEVKLFKLAMSLTEDEYPPYVLTQYSQPMSSLRIRREVMRGERVNFYMAPPRKPGDDLYKEIQSIPIPILKGLLGYRKIIVTRENVPVFNAIKSVEELKKLEAGQARGWPDVAVYKAAGFPVDATALFPDLFHMLEQNRFDYLPLGIMEAEQVLSSLGAKGEDLAVLDSIYIYYPLPVVFQVRAEEKLLIERLHKGLSLASSNGSMDALFNEYFKEYLENLAGDNHLLVVLENPNLESDMGLSVPLHSREPINSGQPNQ